MKFFVVHHTIRGRFISICILFILFFHNHCVAETRIILNALIPEDVYLDMKHFLNGKKPEKIQIFSGKNSRRDVVEPILLIQAMAFGAPEAIIHFVPLESSHDRRLDLIKRGIYDFTSTSVWHIDLEKRHLSAPLINKGEFTAGIYVSPNNKKALAAATLKDIQQLSFVSSKKWIVDWTTLTDLSVKELFHVAKWKFMPKMVLSQRVDALLAPFQPTDDLRFHTEEGDLVPVPGLKVGLKGTRHFGVADKMLGEITLRQALNKGLAHLRQSKTIEQAYRESGFFNDDVKDWLLINHETP